MWTSLVSAVVSTIAMVVIAGYSVASYMLAKAIRDSGEKHDTETRDLYRAIVVANVIFAVKGGYHADSLSIRAFREHFQRAGGNLELFPEEKAQRQSPEAGADSETPS